MSKEALSRTRRQWRGEGQAVALVNSGQYEDYQRMTAGTGNVDSARLLMEFGARASVAEGTLAIAGDD
jgi:hypothetical protein